MTNTDQEISLLKAKLALLSQTLSEANHALSELTLEVNLLKLNKPSNHHALSESDPRENEFSIYLDNHTDKYSIVTSGNVADKSDRAVITSCNYTETKVPSGTVRDILCENSAASYEAHIVEKNVGELNLPITSSVHNLVAYPSQEFPHGRATYTVGCANLSSLPFEESYIHIYSDSGVEVNATSFSVIGGDCYNTSGSWNALSDSRVKQDIIDADVSLCMAGVRSLKLKRFSFKEKALCNNDNHQLGFIAQDVQKILPKSVKVVKADIFKLADKTIGQLLTINDSQINKLCFGAIQYLDSELEKLKSKVFGVLK